MFFGCTVGALLLAASSFTAAQTPSFEDALSKNANLSNYLELLRTTTPDLLKRIDGFTSDNAVTVLAPSNAAFGRIPYVSILAPAWANNDSAAITNILEYMIIPGTHTSQNLNGTFQFLPTLLTNESWTTVTGGQVMGAVLPGAIVPQAVFTSGQATRSVVSQEGIEFTGGIINIVEAIAIPPVPFVDTAETFNDNDELQSGTAFLGAMYSAPSNLSLAKLLNETKDVTVFVPNNIAFEMVSGALTSLSPAALRNYLSYHIITSSGGPPIYSSDITSVNGTNFTSLQGTNLTLYSTNNAYFINSARIVWPDVLMSNGVMHIIDNVLSPNATSEKPQPLSATQAPVFPTTVAQGTSFNSSAAPFTTFLDNIVPTPSSSSVPATTTGTAGALGAGESSTTASASASSASASKTHKGAAAPVWGSQVSPWAVNALIILAGLLGI